MWVVALRDLMMTVPANPSLYLYPYGLLNT
jgi:hypothetical protein